MSRSQAVWVVLDARTGLPAAGFTYHWTNGVHLARPQPERWPRRYAIRRNPGTGRWVMYYLANPGGRPGRTPQYVIMGNADTLTAAIEGIYE